MATIFLRRCDRTMLQVTAAMGLLRARATIAQMRRGRLRDELFREWQQWRVEFEEQAAASLLRDDDDEDMGEDEG